MCGFAGFLTFDGTEYSTLVHSAGSMADTLVHRGPDDSGVWADAASGIALAFRRLSIIDLSPAGHQPMHSADGRYVTPATTCDRPAPLPAGWDGT